MLTYEQEPSAHDALRRAGVRHGDQQEVVIAVGTRPSPFCQGSHLMFCSAEVRPGKILRKGGFLERRKRIEGSLVFHNADEVDRQIGSRTGVAVMRARVVTNGHVEIDVDLSSVQVVPVHAQDEQFLRYADGRELAQIALEMVQS